MEVRQLSKSTSTAAAAAAAGSNDNSSHSFPLVLSAPINGRIVALVPFSHPSSDKDYIFFLTENKKYAIISYAAASSSEEEEYDINAPSSSLAIGAIGTAVGGGSSNNQNHSHNLITHASGDLSDYGLAIRGTEPENGPLVTIEPNYKCIALHLYEGYVSILPIHLGYRYKPYSTLSSTPSSNHRKSTSGSSSYNANNVSSNAITCQGLDFIGPAFHCRIEERDVSSMEFLIQSKPTTARTAAAATAATSLSSSLTSSSSSSNYAYMPQLGLLHQDSRGLQHVIAHSLDMRRKTLIPYNNIGNAGSSGSGGGKKKNESTSISNSRLNQFQQPPMNQRFKKSRVEGGSGIIIPIPPNNHLNSSLFGGVLVLGHRTISFHCIEENIPKVLNISPCFFESHVQVVHASSSSSTPSSAKNENDKTLRFLLGDDAGKVHILAVVRSKEGRVTNLHLDTLGETNVSSSLVYLESGLFFLGSQYTDSQLIQILDEPVEIVSSSNMFDEMQIYEDEMGRDPLLHGRNVTFLSVIEEFMNIGPIVDFDLVPTTHNLIGGESSHSMMPKNHQSMAITASGAGKDGSLRLVSNGIGMTEHAAVELPGIKGMFNIRKSFHDLDDAYLIQSYVGETRILGVAVEIDVDDLDETEDSTEGGATLEEVEIDGIDSQNTTLFAGNLFTQDRSNSSLIMQITDTEVRIVDLERAAVVCSWSASNYSNQQDDSESKGLITVASANELGQIILATGGGNLIYLRVSFENAISIDFIQHTKLDHEISCLSLNPLESQSTSEKMDVDTCSAKTENFDTTEVGPKTSYVVAVGLWDDYHVQLLSLHDNEALQKVDNISISPTDLRMDEGSDSQLGQSLMARSLCFVTLKSTNASSPKRAGRNESDNSVDMLLVGLGDGGLVSFVIDIDHSNRLPSSIHSRKEVSLGTRAIKLVPFYNHTEDKGTCVLATGDRPTVIYLAGGGESNQIPKLCYSNINLETEAEEMENEELTRKRFEKLIINVATPFHSSALFSLPNTAEKNYPLCISDESTLRLGVIDDIQKLHVATHKLGMAPRRVTHHESGRVVCVSCIDDGANNVGGNIYPSGRRNEGHCIRFFDDVSFEEFDRIDLDHFEIVLSMLSTKLKVNANNDSTSGQQGNIYKSFLVVGTAYSYPDEDEPTRGRIILIDCSLHSEITASSSTLSRKAKLYNDIHVSGGVYSLCTFYNGTILATINSKTRLCKLIDTGVGNNSFYLKIDSAGHRGNILSLLVKSMAHQDKNDTTEDQEQIAIVGDLARSISVIKHYPEYGTLEEVARDFNQNWVTAIEMLNLDTYLGGENFHNLFVLRRNASATSEEVRSRLDTSGLFNLGEMVNKFISGSLVIPQNASESSSCSASDASNNVAKSSSRNPTIRIGSQTLYGTVDGTIGSILGLDIQTFTFLSALEGAISKVITPVGNLKHADFRAYCGERRQQGTKGFVDGDLIESFMDLDRKSMVSVVEVMNKERKWKPNKATVQKNAYDEVDDESKYSLQETSTTLTVSDVITIVEEISMLH